VKTIKKVFLVLSLTGLAACAGVPKPLPDSDSPEARLFDSKCGACHYTPRPGRHTYAQWEGVLSRMEKRMEEMKREPLTPDEKSTILGYLKKHAR
jgi:hypothetical protein